ncbi:MAG TPA: hypothetical protein VF458_04580 [Ktedonobacteraceae bacterium]
MLRSTHRLIKSMTIQFLRGNSGAPKGHAIFVARNSADPRTVVWTYCVVPPAPFSLAKFIPPFLTAQMSPEDIQEVAGDIQAMPLSPIMEEGCTLEQLQVLAERRDDDLCDIGSISLHDTQGRMQLVLQSSMEYGQFYLSNMSSLKPSTSSALPAFESESAPLDDLDAEELLLQTMTDRQRLAEMSKLVGLVRYALEGKDTHLVDDTKRRMQRIGRQLPDKYRSNDLITAAANPQDRGARLAELYIERGYKLLDEEYADIPNIEQAIRKLQEQ